jgi:hypothetical protein
MDDPCGVSVGDSGAEREQLLRRDVIHSERADTRRTPITALYTHLLIDLESVGSRRK